ESVYLAGPDGPRRTVQLVIYGRARNTTRVQWTFAPHAVQGTAPAGGRRRRDDEPQLPLGSLPTRLWMPRSLWYPLMPRTSSSHTWCGKRGCELRVQERH